MDARRTLATALAAALLGAGTAHAQTAGPAPCADEALTGAECATTPFPLDHARPDGEQITLAWARYPATGQRQGTLVVVPGGPGQAGLRSAGVQARTVLRGVRATHDLVFYDPRGVGASSPLTCAAAPDGRLPRSRSAEERLAAVQACGEELGARRGLFTTYQESLDLDRLRIALGVEQVSVLGTSYGGQVAGEYARRFPARARSLVLDSTSPIEGIDLLGRLPQLALPRVLRELCFPPECAATFGRDPVRHIRAAAVRLTRSPLRARVVLADGRRRTLTLRAADLSAVVGVSDVDLLARSEVLAAAAAVARGDGAPLARLVVRLSAATGGGTSSVNDVRFLATACNEAVGLPWRPDGPTGPERLRALETALEERAEQFLPFTSGALAPFSGVATCLGWPSTPPSPRAASEGPDVPTLILAGREDLRTPLEDQRRAALQLPRARVVAVPDVGHSVLGNDATDCSTNALAAFLTGGEVQGCTERLRPVPVAAPFAGDLDELPAGDGDVPAVVNRTAVAVTVTLSDVNRQLLGVAVGGTNGGTLTDDVSLRAGGLRGGRVSVGRGSLRLTAYEVVPGVRLTGRLAARTGAGTITVGGTGATGTLRLTETGFTGVLNGERVRFRAESE